MSQIAEVGDADPMASVPGLLSVDEAARLMGIGRTLAYELIRTNEWPTPIVRLGRRIKIPPGPLLAILAGDLTPPA